MTRTRHHVLAAGGICIRTPFYAVFGESRGPPDHFTNYKAEKSGASHGYTRFRHLEPFTSCIGELG